MKEKREKTVRKPSRKVAAILDLTANNYKLFGLAILVIVIGYFFMAQGPVDGFMSLTLAPIVLIIGYCVIVPYAIFWKAKKSDGQTSAQ
jgi:hypothetical protein